MSDRDVIHERMAVVFNEWAKRYADNPAEFEAEILDKDGRPFTDYGDRCATYFRQLASEMDAIAKLPHGVVSIAGEEWA